MGATQKNDFFNNNSAENINLAQVELIESQSQEIPLEQIPASETTLPGEVVLVPLSLLVVPWILFFVVPSAFWKNLGSRMSTIKTYHQIPCHKCQYYNHNAYLQCAIHPCKALSAEAINCSDFAAKNNKSVFTKK